MKSLREKQNKRVVITGYGGYTSMGKNAEDIWNAIMAYQVGYARHTFDDDTIVAQFFGLIDFDPELLKKFPKRILKILPMFAKYALISAHQALDMAFKDADGHSVYSEFDKGIIIGTGWGALDTSNECFDSYRKYKVATSFSTVMSMCNAATAALAMNWNFRGYQGSPVAACAAGNIAVGDAYEKIKSGQAKLMLAGGSESLKHQFNVWSADVLQALSKEQDNIRLASCPFSKGRSGFVLSEGAAVLCLEEYESAVTRGAPILAEVVSYANYCDAYDMVAPAPDLAARVKVIEALLERAEVTASQIDYINLHGTSTQLNDANETLALKKALGPIAYDIPMSSTKSYTGHLVGAAGALETIFCVKSLETGVLPATIHIDEADPDCDLNYIPHEHMHQQSIDYAMNLNFGFGGNNSGIILKRVM